MIPKGLKKGDWVGVVSTSEPITEDCVGDVEKAAQNIKKLGLNVKFGKCAYGNPTGYGETAKHKAEDLNEMFKDKDIVRNILYDAVDITVILCLII